MSPAPAVAKAGDPRTATADSVVRDGEVIAMIGDSITEIRQYSSYIETYLSVCQPKKFRLIQFGWGGETVRGLQNRLADPLLLRPTLVTLCYGMNDAGYLPMADENRKSFHENLKSVINTFQDHGARVIVSSPGCVDPVAFKRPFVRPADYNVALRALRDTAEEVAGDTGATFVDIYTPMLAVTQAAKQKFGPDFSVAGADGIHPAGSGGLVMTHAFLKAMGCDGDLGRLQIDLNQSTALTTGRHRLAGHVGHAFTFESRTYPFCFVGNPADPGLPVSVADLFPFDQDLNRLNLTVRGDAAHYRVTWGEHSQTFEAGRLSAGINLATEFRQNPFVSSFVATRKMVIAKQEKDSLLLKQLLNGVHSARPLLAEHHAALDAIAAAIPAAQERLSEELIRSVRPVVHTLTVEPINSLWH